MTTEQKVDRIDSNVSMLIDQVGRMTEGITELRLVIGDGFTEIKESMTRMESNLTRMESNLTKMESNLTKMDESLERLKHTTEEQAKISAEQTANITRLTLVAESQAATVDHLAKMVGQFLREKQDR